MTLQPRAHRSGGTTRLWGADTAGVGGMHVLLGTPGLAGSPSGHRSRRGGRCGGHTVGTDRRRQPDPRAERERAEGAAGAPPAAGAGPGDNSGGSIRSAALMGLGADVKLPY